MTPQAALEQKQYRHAAYDGLEDFVERFGARPSGSDELENAIDFMKKKAEDDGFRVSDEIFTEMDIKQENGHLSVPTVLPISDSSLDSV